MLDLDPQYKENLTDELLRVIDKPGNNFTLESGEVIQGATFSDAVTYLTSPRVLEPKDSTYFLEFVMISSQLWGVLVLKWSKQEITAIRSAALLQ